MNQNEISSEILRLADERFLRKRLKGQEILIDDPMVVTKSYPEYWNDLMKIGFEINEV